MPDPIDGLGRVGKIQEFLEDLNQLLGSDLPGILLVSLWVSIQHLKYVLKLKQITPYSINSTSETSTV